MIYPTTHHSYQTFPFSPAELESDCMLDDGGVSFEHMARDDDFEKYADLMPFNEWDYLPGEEPEPSYYAALAKLAEFDDYYLYSGEMTYSRASTGGPDLKTQAEKFMQENAIRCGILKA